MGDCFSSAANAGSSGATTDGGNNTDQANASSQEQIKGDLFGELGVALLNRPDVSQLLDFWYTTVDLDRNDIVTRDECRSYLKAVSQKWGDGLWSRPTSININETAVDGNESGQRSSSPPSEALLSNENVTFEAVRSALWDPPVFGIPASTALLFQRAFLRELRSSEEKRNYRKTGLRKKKATELAKELLDSVHARRADVKRVEKSLNAVRGHENQFVTFEEFIQRVGPVYLSAAPTYDAFSGLDEDLKGDLPLDGVTIHSFAPVRENTPCEILNCGEATITTMFHAMRKAESEIMTSWYMFCPTVPAIRSAELGASAWFNPEGTLPPLLKSKAEEGVKVYIILWDIVDVVIFSAPVVEYAIQSLGGAHPNIHVVAHPGWNVWTHTHHQKFVVCDRHTAILGGIDWTMKRWDTPDHPLFDPDSAVRPGMELQSSDRPFKDNISDWWVKPQEELFDNRGEQATIPWQDVSVCVRGKAAEDVARNFIQRWNHIRQDVVELLGDGLRNDMPAISSKIKASTSSLCDDVVGKKVKSSLATGGFASPGVSGTCRCQIVRSLGKWSGEIRPAEISHYEAWIAAIDLAERFIYVEQQYFIANMGEGDAKNRVAEAILRRVQHAVDRSEPFHVYIIVPEMTQFEQINYFARRTLLQDGQKSRGNSLCLMSRVQLALQGAQPGTLWDGAQAESVLSVCTINSVGRSASGRWDVSEIFVHSKVLIVDDRIAIIGSANVCDRSFVGYSDSELGAILWDDGGGTVRDFRLRLWRQYLGLAKDGSEDGRVSDPSSKEAYQVWTETAENNFQLITAVFDHTPRDTITHYKQFKKLQDSYESKSPEEKGASLNDPGRLKNVRGQLVKYPPEFLGNQRKKNILVKFTETFPLTKAGFL